VLIELCQRIHAKNAIANLDYFIVRYKAISNTAFSLI